MFVLRDNGYWFEFFSKLKFLCKTTGKSKDNMSLVAGDQPVPKKIKEKLVQIIKI